MNPKYIDCEHSSENNGKSGLKVGSSKPIVNLPQNAFGGCRWPSVGDYVIDDESCSAQEYLLTAYITGWKDYDEKGAGKD